VGAFDAPPFARVARKFFHGPPQAIQLFALSAWRTSREALARCLVASVGAFDAPPSAHVASSSIIRF